MRRAMRKHAYFAWFIWVVVSAPAGFATSYTLEDVIKASEEVAKQTPSQLAADLLDKSISIQGDTYELRLFTFEQKDPPQAQTPTFRDFITQWDCLFEKPQQRAESFIPTDYFTATPAMQKEGYTFLLSLRKVTDPGLLEKLAQRKRDSTTCQ
jgi:hypothetical protein